MLRKLVEELVGGETATGFSGVIGRNRDINMHLALCTHIHLHHSSSDLVGSHHDRGNYQSLFPVGEIENLEFDKSKRKAQLWSRLHIRSHALDLVTDTVANDQEHERRTIDLVIDER